MKKTFVYIFFSLMMLALFGCSDSEVSSELMDLCDGSENFVVIDGQCIVYGDDIEESISIESEGTDANIYGADTLMVDYFADLSDSVGLAVIPIDIYEQSTVSSTRYNTDILKEMALLTETENAENIIVKLTEEGFFEAVDFMNGEGTFVNISANPLTLDVMGDYTVVVFEVHPDQYDSSTSFMTKVYDSLSEGGIYIIHNESGKMFPTKTFDFSESYHSETENHSRTIHITVTVDEPIYETQEILRVDEFGDPVLDEYGDLIYDEVQVPVLDADGNQLIFTQGPIQTAVQNVVKVEYYKVPLFDNNGNPVLDPDTNQQKYDIIEKEVRDNNGNLVYEDRAVPVTDGQGNPIYLNEFEIDLYIEDIRTVNYTDYYANVADNALTPLAERLVSKIVSKYFNWDYRQNKTYVLSTWGFAIGESELYFIKTVQGDTQVENILMKMSFDLETEEIVVEEYLNLTRSGFTMTNSEIIRDPETGNIIYNPLESGRNMQVYSSVSGLKTITDSANLHSFIFVDGRLFFMKNTTEYVTELGYDTLLLYYVGSDGTLHHENLELGVMDSLCEEEKCDGNYILYELYDQYGVLYGEGLNGAVAIEYYEGDSIIKSADLTLTDLGDYETARPACTESICYYDVTYIFLYEDGSLFAEANTTVSVTPADPLPPFTITYTFNSQTQINYTGTTALTDNTMGNIFVFIDSGNEPPELIMLIDMQVMYNQGDQIIESIVFEPETQPTSTSDLLYCRDEEGCIIVTETFEILNEFGVDIASEYYSNNVYIPVSFEYGDILPSGEFVPVFTISNIEYYTYYLQPRILTDQSIDLVELTENLFLIYNNTAFSPMYNVIIEIDVTEDKYLLTYTNLANMDTIQISGDSFIAINGDKTAILKLILNDSLSTEYFYYFDSENLTEGLLINAINELIVDYDGTLYFKGVDNFVHDISGVISVDGVVTIDTVYVEREVVRVSPIN